MAILLDVDTDSINKPKDLHDENEILSGDYWVNKETGKMRLIRSLTVIDNILHSIKVLAHPEDKKSQYDDLTLDEFLDSYYYIDQEKAKEIRKEEIQKVQDEIQEVGKKLAQGYIEESSGVSASAMLTSASMSIKSDMSLPISMAKNNQVESIKENIERTKDIAAKQNAFISEHTGIISEKSNLVSIYYTEISEQNLAAIDGTMNFVKKLNQGVKTLDIFLGEGVQALQISDGEPASDDEPLTFYQRKLFLDEEFFYNLANGGADCNSLKAFSEAIESGSKILDNIAPNPKSVVLMQFRREAKSYGNSQYAPTIQSVMAEVAKDQADKEMFLFVRNGKRVHLIFSENIMGGKRLFPTGSEVNAYFKDRQTTSKLFDGVEVDNYINFHDIRNAKARESFDAKSRYYQRIILMLNGIHSRGTEVFGKIEDAGYRDWLSLDFQQKCFKFVHDDEDALAYNTTSLADFVSSHNNRIQKGSRVIGNWKNIVNEDNAKGLYGFSDFRDAQLLYGITDTQEPLQVAEDKKGIYITLAAKHQYSYPEKEKNVRVYLNDVSHHLLCVDYIQAKDIQYYLDSRHARASYVAFARLLIGARDMLRREEEEAQPIVDALREHIINLFPALEPESVDNDIFKSIALWKVGNKTYTLPREKDEGYSRMVTSISDIFYHNTLGSKVKDIVAYAEGDAKALGSIKKPLCVTTDAKLKYYLYSEVDEDSREFLGLGEDEEYPFVYRSEITFKKEQACVKSTTQVLYRDFYRGEETVHSFYHSKEEKRDRGHRGIDPEYVKKIQKLRVLQGESAEVLKKLESGENVDEMLLYFLKKKEDMNNKKRSKYVLDYDMSLFMGGYMLSPHTEWEYHVDTEMKLVEYCTNIDVLVARYGSDEVFEKLTEWISKRYRNPQNRLIDFETIRESKSSVFFVSQSTVYMNGQSLPSPKSEQGFLCNSNIIFGGFNATRVNQEAPLGFDEIVLKKRAAIEEERINKQSDKKHKYILTTIIPKGVADE